MALTWVCSTTAQLGEAHYASSTAVEDIKPHNHISVLFPSGEVVIAHEPFWSVSGWGQSIDSQPNKTEIWQLMLLIISTIASLLSTNRYAMSGRAEKNVRQLSKTPNLQLWAAREPGICARRLRKTQFKLQRFKELLPNICSSPWSWVGKLHRGLKWVSVSGNCYSHSEFHPLAFMNWHSLTREKIVDESCFTSFV